MQRQVGLRVASHCLGVLVLTLLSELIAVVIQFGTPCGPTFGWAISTSELAALGRCSDTSWSRYPLFHLRYWCRREWYARENCLYTFTGLREKVPEALNSVSPTTIHHHYLHCMRTIDAYAAGVKYGTEEFKKRVYKGHRQVVDKSKW